jgi:hypothetical protein
MGFLDFFRSTRVSVSREPNAEPNASEGEPISPRLVEAIIEDLRRVPPKKPLCYLVLFGNRPLTAPMKGDECACVFSRENLATAFMSGYKGYYACQQPLSILAVKSIEDLWAILHTRSSDPLYKLPLGLIINFSYSGGPFQNYGVAHLESMGVSGLAKGLNMIR